jgi:hypothetical protein
LKDFGFFSRIVLNITFCAWWNIWVFIILFFFALRYTFECGFDWGWVYKLNVLCIKWDEMRGKLIDGCEGVVYSCFAMVPITHIKWKSLIHWKETQGQRQSQAKPSQAKPSKQASWAHHTSNDFGSWLGLKIRERLCKGRSRFRLIPKILGNVRKMFTRC